MNQPANAQPPRPEQGQPSPRPQQEPNRPQAAAQPTPPAQPPAAPQRSAPAEANGGRPAVASQAGNGRAASTGPADVNQGDLERVRQIIMGNPESTKQPVREAEAERLRNVLFGAKIEEYERRFVDMRREIDRALNDSIESRDAMREFSETQRERMEVVEHELRQAHEELAREVERTRAQGPLIQQLVPQTRQMQSAINGLTQEVTDLRAALTRENQALRALKSMIDQYRDQNQKTVDTIKREKRQAEDELKAELRRIADRLDDEKTDRKVLAAILIEVAARLESGYGTTSMLEDFATVEE